MEMGEFLLSASSAGERRRLGTRLYA